MADRDHAAFTAFLADETIFRYAGAPRAPLRDCAGRAAVCLAELCG
jgi:hypothetical protein